MAIFKLPRRVVQIIENKIGSLFENVKSRLLGPRGGGDKNIYITYDKALSLPGIYEAASNVEMGIPDLQTLDTMIDTSKNYIDALKLKTVNKVIKEIESHIANGSPTPVSIEKALSDSWKEVSAQLGSIVDAETQASKNIGLLNGIINTNAAIRIEDPIIFFIVTRDHDLCDECKKLHLLEDGVTPRLWYLSEINRGYHKRGLPTPSIVGLHPHCRCLMATLLPGYSFNDKGRITFKTKAHDELKIQRGE